MLLTIRHRTVYRYARPVGLLPHRLMLCPRGNHDLRLLSRRIDCAPAASLDWSEDVFGNLVATAAFAAPADRLAIDSHMVVEQCAEAWPILIIAPSAHLHPFDYPAEDVRDLGALRDVADADPTGRVAAFANGFVTGRQTDTLALLQAINARIHAEVNYRWRDEEGTQSPAETLAIASGSCRDLATLLIETARRLGFGARAVSGYLYDAGGDAGQHGATHAWAEIYLPAAGWIAFDPANGRMGSANLVPVAVARAIGQIMPVTGGYSGSPQDFVDMQVDVRVTASAAAD